MERLKRQLPEAPSDVDKCPKTATEIKKEMHKYSNIMKFIATELDIDEENEAKVQDNSIYTI
jgi:F0F1-type ATP synthase alpha subunit